MDLQQCVGLLHNESVRAWLQCGHSSLLWTNTSRTYGTADWATAFATRLIEYAGKLDNMTVLYHFCGNQATSRPVSTPAVLVQSLVMQTLQLYHKSFLRKAFPFTLGHFEDAADDLEDLWGLFIDCCVESQVACVWLIVDHIDNLQKGEDYDALLANLRGLTEEDSRIFKVYISARSSGTPAVMQSSSTTSTDGDALSRIFTVTVPRAQSRLSAAMLSKQKRLARIPDASPERAPIDEAEIADLLDSSSDDLLSGNEVDEDADKELVVESPTSMTSPTWNVKARQSDESGLSDSSLDFVKEDPFETSEESEWEKRLSDRPVKDDVGTSNSEDEEEDLTFGEKKELVEETAAQIQSSSDEHTRSVPKGRGQAKPLTKTKAKPGLKPGSDAYARQKGALASSSEESDSHDCGR